MHRVKLNPAPGYMNSYQFCHVEMGAAAEAQRAHAALQVGAGVLRAMQRLGAGPCCAPPAAL